MYFRHVIKSIGAFLRYYLFWYLIFVAARIVFIFFNSSGASQFSAAELFSTFYHGAALDISMVSYLCVLPLVIWVMAHFIRSHAILNKVLKGYNILLLTCVILLVLADAELYRFWEQKINAYASSFAKFPKEMAIFSSGSLVLQPIITLLLFVAFAWILYKKLATDFDSSFTSVKKVVPLICFPVFGVLLFLGIRGGTGKSVINQSSAFFSVHPFLNHAAVNTAWNFLASVVEPLETTKKNPYKFIDDQEAEALIGEYRHKNNVSNAVSLTDLKQPNILFVLLEGWGADVVEPCGGEAGVTPHLNKLIAEGYFFSRFYANGNRTDKGLAAVLSAQPALAHSSIINHIEKFNGLPSLPAAFANNGYYTSFYYGGDSKFANMKGYLLSAGVKDIFDLDVFPLNQRNAEWGVHDDVLLNNLANGLGKQTQPFFSIALTLSSHEPFRIPAVKKYGSNSDADDYRSSVYYADSCIGAFFNQVKDKPWYKNTLIVIVADHGHQWPKDRKAYDPERYHIPFIITGGALNQELKGKVNNRIAAQVDIASSLLRQFGWSDTSFTWSRNFMDTGTKAFASFVLNDAIGWVNDSARLVFDQETKKLIYYTGNLTPQRIEYHTKKARAYEQVYFNEYIKR